jgi:hypothetical protein
MVFPLPKEILGRESRAVAMGLFWTPGVLFHPDLRGRFVPIFDFGEQGLDHAGFQRGMDRGVSAEASALLRRLTPRYKLRPQGSRELRENE